MAGLKMGLGQLQRELADLQSRRDEALRAIALLDGGSGKSVP